VHQFVRQTKALIAKDVRREVRTGEIVTTAAAFSVLLTVVFAFAFYEDQASVQFVFPGILWVAVVFTGTLVITRTFAQEADNDCLQALALIPGAPASVFTAKLLVNLAFMSAFELLLLPLLSVAFNVDIAAHAGWYLLIVFEGTLGFAALGTLISAMLVQNRLRDILLPLLLYPLAVPLLIAGVQATTLLYTGDLDSALAWMRIIAGFDLLFVAVSYVLFRSVLRAIE
jgi:heme exporter protein B